MEQLNGSLIFVASSRALSVAKRCFRRHFAQQPACDLAVHCEQHDNSCFLDDSPLLSKQIKQTADDDEAEDEEEEEDEDDSSATHRLIK